MVAQTKIQDCTKGAKGTFCQETKPKNNINPNRQRALPSLDTALSVWSTAKERERERWVRSTTIPTHASVPDLCSVSAHLNTWIQSFQERDLRESVFPHHVAKNVQYCTVLVSRQAEVSAYQVRYLHAWFALLSLSAKVCLFCPPPSCLCQHANGRDARLWDYEIYLFNVGVCNWVMPIFFFFPKSFSVPCHRTQESTQKGKKWAVALHGQGQGHKNDGLCNQPPRPQQSFPTRIQLRCVWNAILDMLSSTNSYARLRSVRQMPIRSLLDTLPSK